jgi:hypothetical protein
VVPIFLILKGFIMAEIDAWGMLKSAIQSVTPDIPIMGNDQVVPGVHIDGPVQVITPETGPIPEYRPQPSEAEQFADGMNLIDVALADSKMQEIVTTARDRGNGVAVNNLPLNQYEAMDGVDFIQRYGKEAYDKLTAYKTREGAVRRAQLDNRSDWEHIGDDVQSVAQGAVQGVGGLVTFGLGLQQSVPVIGPYAKQAAVATSELMDQVRKTTEQWQSDELNEQRKFNAIRQGLDAMDNEAQSQQDAVTDSPLMTGLKSVGRDAINAGSRLLEDPAMLETGVSEGTGSLLVGGPAAKGIKIGVSALTRVGEKVVEKAAFPVAVGAMEGGGAYQQAAVTVMQMPIEELQKSPVYQGLIQEGLSDQEARTRIAANAGIVASLPAFGVGALTGKLVERFEGNPLKAIAGLKSAGGMAANSVREFIEEAIQSGAGQASSNLGQVVSGANPDQPITEGVGQAATEGGLFGSLVAPALQAPAAAAKGAVAAVLAPLKYVGRKLGERADKVTAENEASSAVSPEKVNQDINDQTTNTEPVVSAISAMAEKAGQAFTKGKETIQPYIDRVVNAGKPEVPENNTTVSTVVNSFRENQKRDPNLFETAEAVARKVLDKSADIQDRIQAGTYLLRTQEVRRKLFQEDLPKFMDSVKKDSKEWTTFARYGEALNAMQDTPIIKEALEEARKFVQPETPFYDINEGEEFGGKVYRNTIDLAVNAPENMNPRTAMAVLKQADEGVIQLTTEERKAIRAALELQKSARISEAAQRLPEGGLVEGEVADLQDELDTLSKSNIEFVNRQIEDNGGNKAHQLSLKQHTSRILQAVAEGNTEGAKRAAERLNMFAQSMSNKVTAMNTSAQEGKGRRVNYSALRSDGKMSKEDGTFSVYYNEKSAKSEGLSRQINAEAQAVANLANYFAKEYPELGMSPVQIAPAIIPGKSPKEAGSSTLSAGPSEQGVITPQAQSADAELPATDQAASTSQPDENKVLEPTASREEEAKQPVPDNSEQPVPSVRGEDETGSTKEVAGDVKTSPDAVPEQSKSRISKEDIQNKDKISDARVINNLRLLQQIPRDQRTAEDRATYQVVDEEMIRRGLYDDVSNLTDDELINELEALEAIPKEKRTSADRIHHASVDAEMLRRDLYDTTPEPETKDENQNQEKEPEQTSEETSSDVSDQSAPAETPETESVKPQETSDQKGETADIEDNRPAIIKKTPNLIAPNGRNFFHKAYRMARTAKSRAWELARPLADMKRMLKNVQEISDFAVGVEYVESTDQLDRMHDYLDIYGEKVLQTLKDRLNAALTPEIKESLKNGEEKWLRSRDTRILNLLDQTPKGLRYNPQLIQTAVLAGMDWALNADAFSTPATKQEIAAILGISIEKVTKTDLDDFQLGISTDSAVEALSKNILDFWGVTPNKDARSGFTTGIVNALAKEILHSLEEAELIKLGVIERPNLSDKSTGRVWFHARPLHVDDMIKSLYSIHPLISDSMMIERDIQGYQVGKVVEEIDETQHRNPLLTLTPQNKQVLRVLQKTAFLLNTHTSDFMENMEIDDFIEMMLGLPFNTEFLDPKNNHIKMKMNVNDYNSIKGKIISLKNSYENVFKQVAFVRNYALKEGLDPNNIRDEDLTRLASYYRYHINKLGRAQMGGLSNPQVDKLAREIFMPNRAVLDMTQKANQDLLMLAVAQGIGIKTEKSDRTENVKETRKRTLDESGDLFPLVQALKDWTRAKNNDGVKTISPELKQLMKDAGLTMHGYQSLLSLAQYEVAREDGKDLKKFTTFAYLEADGKTNGPINSMVLLFNGEFTADYLENIARGGVFIGRLDKTLNSEGNVPDLYKRTGQIAAEATFELEKQMLQFPDVHEQLQRFKRFFSALSIDYKFGEDADGNPTIIIERGLAKNPLTITVYGSGLKGIAENLTDEILSVVYEKISESVQKGIPIGELLYNTNDSQGNFLEDFTALTTNTPKYDRDADAWALVKPKKSDGTISLTLDTTIDGYKYGVLSQNVRQFLVEPMSQGIKAVTGKYVAATADAMQKAAQIQSIFLKAFDQQDTAKRIAVLNANPVENDYTQGEGLTQNERRDIQDNLRRFSPIIETSTQKYMMSGSERGAVVETTVVPIDGKNVRVVAPEQPRSLTNKLPTHGLEFKYSYAGMKPTPTLVIGSGDAQTVANAVTSDQQFAARVLQIFDGINIPVDAIEAFSRHVNKAAWDAWFANDNPVEAALSSYKAFLEQNPWEYLFGTNNPTDELTAEQRTVIFDISKVLAEKGKLTPEEMLTVKQAKAYLNQVLAELEEVAFDTGLNKKTMAAFIASIDQYASGESPHVKDTGISPAPEATLADIAIALQAEKDRLKSLSGSKAAQSQSVEARLSSLAQEVAKLGAKDDDTGAVVLQTSDIPALQKFMDNKGRLNTTQKEMLSAAAKTLKDQGFSLVFGSVEELSKWEEKYQADTYIPGSHGNALGKFSPSTKTIFVSDINPETIVHEMVHASTYYKVHAYYNNKNVLSKEDQEAVQRTEGLMNEWLLGEFQNENADTLTAYSMASSAVIKLLRQSMGKNVSPQKAAEFKAQALNEFMAWVLGNQHLADLAAKTEIQNPLFRIVGEALAFLRNLIWGGPNKGPKLGPSVLSNLRFNARVLMTTPTPTEYMRSLSSDLALYQSLEFGNDDALSRLRETFDKKLSAWMNEPNDVFGQEKRDRDAQDAIKASIELGQVFAAYFPSIATMQGYSTFKAITASFMVDMSLNPNSLIRINELYEHVMENLEAGMFRERPEVEDPTDQIQAQDKFNTLSGTMIVKTDKHGRSSLMSTFLALSMIDPQFRKILSEMPLPASEKNKDGSLDATLMNAGTASMDHLSTYLSGQSFKDKNIQATLDSLTVEITNNVNDQKSFIEKSEGILNRIDADTGKYIQSVTGRLVEQTKDVIEDDDASTLKKATFRILGTVSTFINETTANEASLGLIRFLAKEDRLKTFAELVSDVVGRNRFNAPIFDMASRVKETVQQARQQFREEVPKKLAREFTRHIQPDEWTSMFKVMGKTDFAGLHSYYGFARAFELIAEPTALRAEIRSTERSLRMLNRDRYQTLISKTKQLSEFMVNGRQGVFLLRNATAIDVMVNNKDLEHVDNEQVVLIDRLATLYALEITPQSEKDIVKNLNETQKKGLMYTASYLLGQRKDELYKVQQSPDAIMNHYKGWLPSESQSEGSLIIAPESATDALRKRGYTKLVVYTGDALDRTLGRRAYFYAPVNGLAPFNQGIMQTVHLTASGVDPQTGYTVGEVQGGRITDPDEVLHITRNLGTALANSTENLLPVFTQNGEAYAYERGADVEKLTPMNRNTNLAEQMGVWHGRQIEEVFAREVNSEFVHKLFDIWHKDENTVRKNEYVNIYHSDDPVLKEVRRLIPNHTRPLIEELFGRRNFMVHRSMLNDLGYRQASVGDLITGESRWNPKMLKEIQKISFGIYGNKAHNILVGGEQILQEFVANAKLNIVVKSVVVPAANLISNLGQLLNRGVPFKDIIRGVPRKTAEINYYIKSRAKEIDLEADERVAEANNDQVSLHRIRNRLQAIKDSYKRLSIYPLLEAGEFSAITNGQVTAEDLALANGKWSTFVERYINNLPNGVRTPVRYAFLTRDTALFQGLARSVQYGDFIAKAILYEDLTVRKNLSEKEAIPVVNEAFVNYNRLGGRARSYLESVGLLWFFNYKLRIMKEAAYLLRHHPLRSLLMMGLPIGNPVGDNLVAAAADGSIDYSVGWEMGLHSLSLNPWYNAITSLR